MDKKDDTAHLIDTEPVLLLGCNNIEIFSLGALGFIFSLVVGIVLLMPFGMSFLALPFSFLIALATIYFGGRRLGKAKEGKPDGYYNRYLRMKLSSLGIKKANYVNAGYWRIRR
ncbi:MAG: TIGR03750 family conjugal transfer protein [Gammaproteobacteria bacterium]|nr:TIGR03750 family conjugal transfer protein [Gammaproteobacteria bacterium]